MSVDVKDLRKGDWVRFLTNGELFIGVVEYLGKDPSGNIIAVITDCGQVRAQDVLEIRKSG